MNSVPNALPDTPVVMQILRLPHGEGLPIPSYATPGSAGLDLAAAIDQPVTLASGERALIPTGLSVAIPVGFEGQVRPRSGLALRHGIGMVNAPGTIDSDYRGEVCVLLVNLGDQPFVLRRGDRIAQLVISPVARVIVAESDVLDSTVRGAGGFGHTGV